MVVPFIELWEEYTRAALEDCLAQTVEPKVILAIDNGSSRETALKLHAFSRKHPGVLPWHHCPPLPTLNATWNAALDCAWDSGARHALVVNNDVRLEPHTYALLLEAMTHYEALFVSAVGVKDWDQYTESWGTYGVWNLEEAREGHESRGGPDFSCFLISRECHERFRFDEQFTYYGDNDYHRTLKLAGEGERIFGVAVPYLHFGSKTINRSPETAVAYAEVFREHQKRYQEKWGGLPGEERFDSPYNQVREMLAREE